MASAGLEREVWLVMGAAEDVLEGKADQNDNIEEGAPGGLGGWAGGQVDRWAGEWAGLRQRRKEEGWVVEESGVR